MRIARLITFVGAASLSLAPAYAQGHGGGHASPTVTHGNPHTTTATASSSTKTTAGTTTTSGTTPTTTTTPPPTTINPIAAKISSHPQLATKVTTLLPKGMTLNQASSGFRNQGQFIAALHVSRNLNIPFAQLKATMLGTSSGSTTASKPMSLGQAIHTLRPSADSETEADRATTQTSTDVNVSASVSTSTSTTTHK